MKAIQLVTATNDAYALPLGVMLKSLLENKKSDYDIKIYIISSTLSKQNQSNFIHLLKNYNLVPIFKSISEKNYSSLKLIDYISKESYYRLSIPNLLDKNIKKVIYLDCDLIVKKDITALWEIDLDNYFLAAVENLPSVSSSRIRALSIPRPYSYFNSGVLLMNLSKWRQYKAANQVIDYVKRNPGKIRFPDQDAMNAILYDKWLKLDPKWNYTTLRHSTGSSITPAIIHFTGDKKPWNSDHPLKKEYMRYYNMIRWV
ncbi:glycosyltransferase family 8 protein [Ammoniphilus resinae]|uniref:Lipopolysaccharide biosynthesis glycosyltransferase n=1 Tax=Ammoniphilus resinae TaxID=861532 RepID=A0ABS4GRW4_9BACL|nr:lipopolysaccharide biosynthesis glycosyltransferase [Ammoniphilus resinae]